MPRRLLLGLLTGLPLFGCAAAADKASTQVQAVAQSADSTLSASDAAFFDRMARAGIELVAFGQLARSRTASTAIDDLAVRMIAAQTAINQRLTRLAAAKRITPPLDMDLVHQQQYAALDRLHGRDFDLAYLNGLATDQAEMLALLRGEAVNGTDRQIRAFASHVEPQVRTHLRMVEQLGGRPAPREV